MILTAKTSKWMVGEMDKDGQFWKWAVRDDKQQAETIMQGAVERRPDTNVLLVEEIVSHHVIHESKPREIQGESTGNCV